MSVTAVPGAVEAAPVKSRRSWRQWYLFLAFLMLYTWAYMFLGSILVIEKNSSRLGNAQAGHIESVYQAHASVETTGGAGEAISNRVTRLLPHYTDGNIQPLWPWLMGPFAAQPPDALFLSGKWMNLTLSCGLMVLFGVAAAKAFSFTGSAAIILMGGFGVILERSAFFSPDAVYYLLVVLTWLCGLSLIRQNRLWLYAVFGICLGLTFLARPPVWPLLTSFLIVSLIRSVFEAWRATQPDRTDSGWVNSNQLVGFAMLVTAFLIVTGPRLSFANERFGDSLHSYQNYFVWMENPADAVRFQRAYPDKTTLGTLTLQSRPGPVRFFRENGGKALASRATEGALEQLKSSVFGRSGWILIYGFFVFLTIAVIHRLAMRHQSQEVWRVRGTSARWMLVYLASMILLTFFYTGIGNPVIPGNAMTTALFIPTLLTFVWIAERYRRQLQRSHYARLANRAYGILMVFPIIWISIRIYEAIQSPVV